MENQMDSSLQSREDELFVGVVWNDEDTGISFEVVVVVVFLREWLGLIEDETEELLSSTRLLAKMRLDEWIFEDNASIYSEVIVLVLF